jgi:hypothetical protein
MRNSCRLVALYREILTIAALKDQLLWNGILGKEQQKLSERVDQPT